MSQVHRVIILNKALKIRGFSIMQWVLLGLSAAISLWVGFSAVPQNLKIGNVPVGLLVGVTIFGATMALISALEMKPIVWWKNQFLYRLKLVPVTFLPHPEPAQEYPDSSIIEPKKLEDQYYVQ